MSDRMLLEEFETGTLDPHLAWRCPPSRWSIDNSRLIVEPDAKIHSPAATPIECGLYACCPKEGGFRAEFDFLKAETS